MYTSFNITESRLDELKLFIKTNLPTARFVHNPLKEGNKYFIALTMESADSNKLNELQNKWYDEDHPIIIKKSFWNKIFRKSI